jgi:hypothetical protein
MNRSKKRREIKFQKLYDCSVVEQDDYWKQFFENLSRGKTVKKLVVNEGNVEFIQKGKSIVYVYKDKEPELILVELKDLIRQKLHIHSKKDVYNNQLSWNTEQNELTVLSSQDDWKKIRNKNMKYFLIMKYCIQMKNTKNLNWKNANLLFRTITDALFDFHTHKSTDVIMENGVISSIKDINITENLLIENTRIETHECKKNKKDLRISCWDKYLTNISKMYNDCKYENSSNSEENELIENEDNDDYLNDCSQTINNSCDDDYEVFAYNE